jgi:glycosyltransferase involved in cell wall biosynthesis
VVAPSAAFARATAEAHGLTIIPATVHNGRSPLPLPRVAPHDFAFTAGRLWDKGKNAATLDRAAARLGAPFYAAGPMEGPNGAAIGFEAIKSLGTLGERELARWLAAKPVFVSAALYEPFGLAVLEAAAAGCPLVLADNPTFRELWDGVAAFADPMDADGFAELIQLVIGDDLARARMGQLAQERAALFTVEAMATKMAAIYRSLAGNSAAPASKRATVAA